MKIKKCEKVESYTLKIWKPSLRTTEDTHSGDEIGSKHEYKRKLGKKKTTTKYVVNEPGTNGSVRFPHVSMNLLNMWWVEHSSMVNQWDNVQLLYSRGLQLKKSGSNPFKLQFLGIDAVNCIFLDKYTSIICSLGTIFTHQWEWYRIVRCILHHEAHWCSGVDED